MKLKIKLCAVLITFSGLAFSQNKPVPQLGKNTVKEVIAAMTMEEKVNLVIGVGLKGNAIPAAERRAGLLRLAEDNTFAIPRLGIPSLAFADGPAGLRIDTVLPNDPTRYFVTAFPCATTIASTWNPDLAKRVGHAMGNETLEYGLDVLLAPGMNIQRNPLCGRNFEYFSEDPLVSGIIAAAMVNGIQENGVGTSIKHYAANNSESNRYNINGIISQRALREIYLKGFGIAVKASNPWTIMSSYNKINGTYTSEDYDLLTTILKNEFGFKGLVMTDWFGGRDAAAQQNAGNDLLMPGKELDFTQIRQALANKTLSEAVIDRSIERILNFVLKTPTFRKYQYSNKPNLKENALIAREAAAEGMVLLKNDNNALPLNNKKIALLGTASYDLFISGSGSGEVDPINTVPIYVGLVKSQLLLDEALKKDYLAYIGKKKQERQPRKNILQIFKQVEERTMTVDELETLAKTSDAAIITIGRSSGENSDRKVENDYYLKPEELTLIKNTSETFHSHGKKVIVLLNIGGVVDVAQWRDKVDAILITWLPGQEAGNSIADVISGKVNPSGHLAQSFPMSYNEVPSSRSFPGTPSVRPLTSVYDEGIYVGYRYYNTFNVKPAYEFGYGLSYTNFSIENMKTSSSVFEKSITVFVNVKNTGKVAGKEVVQLYLSAPAKEIDKPESELKAFTKTKLLQPGEIQKISFTLKASDLASFNTARSAWVAEAGKYTIKVGSSCMNIKLQKSFSLGTEIIVEKVNNILNPIEAFSELKGNLK